MIVTRVDPVHLLHQMNFPRPLLSVICACLLTGPISARAMDIALKLQSTIPLPAVTGGDFDHFAVDRGHHRLYVVSEVYGSIEVFKLPDGQHLASYRGVARSPRKIILADHGAALFIADGGDADVKVVNTATFKVEDRIPLEPQPDTGITDRTRGLFYIGNGGVMSHKDSAFISVISIADRRLIGKITVPAGQLKAMAIDYSTQRLFVNMRDKNEVGVVDLKTRRLVATWTIPGPSRNSAMVFDPKTRRLLIGSRGPGKMYVLDANDGTVLQSLDIVDTSDEMIIDTRNRCVYVAGAGGLDVIRLDHDNKYVIEKHIDTLGGKTAAFVPSLGKLYVVHTKGPQAPEAGLQVFDVR
jgi:DNA-binding beta-propeller fold protein YncE